MNDNHENVTHLNRLESKVDKLTEAITQLVLLEERQMNHGHRIGALETEVSSCKASVVIVDRKVDSWVNRGIGIWAVAAVLWTIYLAMRNQINA